MFRADGSGLEIGRASGALALLACTLAALAAAPTGSARASFPGAVNGQIALSSDRDPLGTGNDQLFVMGAGGENPTNISNNSYNEESPSFSADGHRVVFVGDPDVGNDELYVEDADGRNRSRLTNTDEDESSPSFSPDGARIAFVSFANGSLDEIQTMNADGSGRVPLLGGDGFDYTDPVWSPDGSKLAYVRDTGDPNGGTDIWVLDLGTHVQAQLTTGPDLHYAPDWSPDGSRIAYVTDPFLLTNTKLVSNPDIWAMNADGSGKTRLTMGPTDDADPTWSPDGSEIAYSQRKAQTSLHTITTFLGEIHVMRADGTGDRNITNDPAFDDTVQSWQPLGQGVNQTPPAFSGPISVAPILTIAPRPTPPFIRAPQPSPALVAAKRGTTIRFRLSKPASVKLAVEQLRRGVKARRQGHRVCRPTSRHVRRKSRCTAFTIRGWIVRDGKRGRNRVRFTGRIGRKALRPGRYRIRAGAVNGIATPARHRASRVFRIAR